MRGTLRISSSVTPSWLNNPPCTTKYRFRPSGERIAGCFDGIGGSDAETKVASGRAVNTWANN